ncbi:MAG: 3-deoxy-8-phosphooctulonate synthase [Candidatus Euphemobacter frigidus]|nr:3-deoxy-8-phosphooctulonate synthase [Candidatus Euphemobacter frigidus]MDP8275185.1 3-deoxy-8-phosphooctulonate synthase [Candidatus Euphemobacter frigidus]
MIKKVTEFKIGSVPVGGNRPLILIAGLCVIESEEHTLKIAGTLKDICRASGVPLVFKASYDKANRTSLDSYRGPGLREGLRIIERVKSEFGLPVLIDFHREEDAPEVARVADIIQVPAFLCRQTDMILAAARTGCVINVKKGQFLAPDDVKHIIKKIESAGNRKIVITERGVTFGYHNLINDMKAFPIMRKFGYPVIFDATHSVQLPGGGEGFTGGEREFIPELSRAAVGAGCDGIFMEVHDQPQSARSDASSVLEINELPALLKVIRKIDQVVKERDG